MIVCKFGGSSVASLKGLLRIKSILQNNIDRKIIVLSAMGKRDKNDTKLTDLLEDVINHRNSINFNNIFDEIKNRMIDFSSQLNINPHLIIDFNEFKQQIKELSVTKEYILSRGEYFTAYCCAQFLNCIFIDAKDIIEKSYNNRIDLVKISRNLNQLNPNKRYVIPGFYCSNANGKISLLGRGGSDTTGAIIANCINADSYENYSDVNGLLTINDKFSTNFKTIKQLSLGQLINCVNGGATVYCLGAIPYTTCKLEIKNTFNDLQTFTTIRAKSSFYFFDDLQKYSAIKKKENVPKKSFLSGVLQTFTKHKIVIDDTIYCSSALYISLKNYDNSNYVNGIKLTLYGSYSNLNLANIKTLCRSKNIIFHVKRLPRPFQKTVVYFFGNINKEVINKIVLYLEKKNTPTN
jgi:aspartate kinase